MASLQQALELLERGLSIVPMAPRTKDKFLWKWEHLQTELPTVDAMTKEFSTYKDGQLNLGIITGPLSGVCVLEFDSEEALDFANRYLPPTPWRTKSRKGEHWFYRHPGKLVTNRVDVGGRDIDIRGDNGISIAAGSVHPSGHVYERIGDWSVPKSELPVFPEDFIAPERSQGQAPTITPPASRSEGLKRASAWLKKRAPAIAKEAGGGGGDTWTYITACRMFELFELDPADATDLLYREWNPRCNPPWDYETLEKKVYNAYEYRRSNRGDAKDGEHSRRFGSDGAEDKPAADKSLVSFSMKELLEHTFPDRRAILMRGDAKVFKAGNIGQVYAMRGVGKTWFVHTLALVAAFGIEALSFHNPNPCKVLLVDGEMGGEEIQERLGILTRRLNVPSDAPNNLQIIAADWQGDNEGKADYLARLDTPEGQKQLEPYIEEVDLIIIDNRSCLFDAQGETDPNAWTPAQDYLLSLRRKGKAVLLVHHSNRMGGARGLSKPEDPMNLCIKLIQQEDYSAEQGARFRAEFDKHRGFFGAAALPFDAALTETGWQVGVRTPEDPIKQKKIAIKEILDAAQHAKQTLTSANQVIRGVSGNRQQLLHIFGDLLQDGAVDTDERGSFVWTAPQGYLLDLPNFAD